MSWSARRFVTGTMPAMPTVRMIVRRVGALLRARARSSPMEESRMHTVSPSPGRFAPGGPNTRAWCLALSARMGLWPPLSTRGRVESAASPARTDA